MAFFLLSVLSSSLWIWYSPVWRIPSCIFPLSHFLFWLFVVFRCWCTSSREEAHPCTRPGKSLRETTFPHESLAKDYARFLTCARGISFARARLHLLARTSIQSFGANSAFPCARRHFLAREGIYSHIVGAFARTALCFLTQAYREEFPHVKTRGHW